jgi:short-subunit dehydrogenase
MRRERAPIRPVALVTGASAGIGEALARRFAAGGHDLVLVARTAPALRALARALAAEHGVRARAMPADLAEPGAADALADALERAGLQVDVLVNNAGVLDYGPLATMPPGRAQRMVAVNVAATTALCARLVPAMVERGRGRVLNVASIAAFQPIPSLAVYAATKAYVLSFSEALGEELRGTGVGVTALCPGITRTSMLDGAVESNAALAGLPAAVVGTVESVANEGYEACLRGEAIRVPGALNLAATLAARATPKWLVRRLAGAMTRAVG